MSDKDSFGKSLGYSMLKGLLTLGALVVLGVAAIAGLIVWLVSH